MGNGRYGSRVGTELKGVDETIDEPNDGHGVALAESERGAVL